MSFEVVAPVPWFPFSSRRFGRYGDYAKVPKMEVRHGVVVSHPRYPVIPKIGMTSAPVLLTAGVWPCIKRKAKGFDVLDAHYLYPDGVAAVAMARRLNKPVVLTARGSDVNVIPQYPSARRMINWALNRADRVLCVSEGLRDSIVALSEGSVDPKTVRNGVDLDFFYPSADRELLKNSLAIPRFTVLFAGNFVPLKGADLLIDAIRSVPDVDLVMAGSGPMEARLKRLVADSGLADRVRFAGVLDQKDLRSYYQAADALILPSASEGMPNVLLEAMACGTPVLTTPVGGAPEIVSDAVSGYFIESRTPQHITSVICRIMATPLDRGAVRNWCERFSWNQTLDTLRDAFDDVVGKRDFTSPEDR